MLRRSYHMKLHLKHQREQTRNWVKAEARVIKLMLELFISQKNYWVAAHLMCSN